MGEGKFCFFYVLEGEILDCYGIYSRYVLQSADKIRDKVRENAANTARTKASDTFAESAKRALVRGTVFGRKNIVCFTKSSAFLRCFKNFLYERMIFRVFVNNEQK